MTATLRIVRGTVSPNALAGYRVLVDGHVVGMLGEDEVTEFPISATHHLVQLAIGAYHSDAASVVTNDGTVVELTATMIKSDLNNIVQGGFVHLERTG